MISKVAFYELGDVELQSGEVLRRAQISYATYGELNAARDNVVVLPTCYAGTHEDNQCLFGAGRAIDPPSTLLSSQVCLETGCRRLRQQLPSDSSGAGFHVLRYLTPLDASTAC